MTFVYFRGLPRRDTGLPFLSVCAPLWLRVRQDAAAAVQFGCELDAAALLGQNTD